MKEFNHTLQREERISMFENSDLTENIEGERKPDVVCYGDVHRVRSKFQRENVM